jgi:hypothetical protein
VFKDLFMENTYMQFSGSVKRGGHADARLVTRETPRRAKVGPEPACSPASARTMMDFAAAMNRMPVRRVG